MAVYAKAGFQVCGYDKQPNVVQGLLEGKAPASVLEPGLDKLLAESKDNWSVTNDPRTLAELSDVIFVIVPTPSDQDNAFSNEYVLDACRIIGEAIRDIDHSLLIVLVSTVMPGACDGVIIPALERYSEKQEGIGFSFAYSPEFVALGSVIENMMHPDFMLIGCNDERAGHDLITVYRNFFRACDVDVPAVYSMSCINAEIAKLSLNAYLTTKIAFTNQIAGLCEKIEGADAGVVLAAVGADSRIGHKFLRPTCPPGGPCLPRDSQALIYAAKQRGVEMPLSKGTIETNDLWLDRMVEMVGDAKRVAILGLTYKPFTNVTEASPGMALINLLRHIGKIVDCYDPSAVFPIELGTVLDNSDTSVIATPWPEFASLVFKEGTRLIDCWRIIEPSKQPEGVKILYPGTYHA
jgi:UDPglucose 6-dehydrogenase